MHLYFPDTPRSNKMNKRIHAPHDSLLAVGGTAVIYYYYWYSALGLIWAETRAQSGDWYGSGTLHPGQVLRGNLPLLFPTF